MGWSPGWMRGRGRAGRAASPRVRRLAALGLLLLAATAALVVAERGFPLPTGRATDGDPCVPAGGRYLGVHQGRVAVFDGVPGGCGVLAEELEIPVAELPPYQRQALEAGIPFGSEEERLQIMEGLGSEVSK